MLRASVLYTLAIIAGRGGQSLLLVVLSIALKPSQFARYDFALVLATLVAGVATFGFDNAAGLLYLSTGDQAERRTIIGTASRFSFGAVTLAGLLLLVFAQNASHASTYNVPAAVFRTAAFVALGFYLLNLITGYYQWAGRSRRVAGVSLATPVTLVSVALLIPFVRLTAVEVLGIQAACYLLVCVTFGVPIFRMLRYWSATTLKALLRLGFPYLVYAVAAVLLVSADRYVVAAVLAPNRVGPYALAARLGTFVNFALAGFQMVWGPFAYSIREKQGAAKAYARVTEKYVLFSTGLAVIINGVGVPAVRAVAPSYQVSGRLVWLLTLAYIINGLFVLLATGSTITRRPWHIAFAAIVGAAVPLIAWTVDAVTTADGVAILMVVANLTAAIVMYLLAQADFKVPYRLLRLAGGLIVAALVSGIVAVIPTMNASSAILAICAMGVATALLRVPQKIARELRAITEYLRKTSMWV